MEQYHEGSRRRIISTSLVQKLIFWVSSKLIWRRNLTHTPFNFIFLSPNSFKAFSLFFLSKIFWSSKHVPKKTTHIPPFQFSHKSKFRDSKLQDFQLIFFFTNIFWATKHSPKKTNTHTPFSIFSQFRNSNFKALNLYFSFQTLSEHPNTHTHIPSFNFLSSPN